MYKQRPAVDYLQLGSLLEDDESKAAAELEAAVEESRKSSASANSQTQHRESTKIPSVIAHESSGLVDAGLVDDWSILPEEVKSAGDLMGHGGSWERVVLEQYTKDCITVYIQLRSKLSIM